MGTQADEAEFTNFAIGFLVFLVALWALLSEYVSTRCKHLGEGSIACLLGLFAGLNLFIFSSASNKDINRSVEKDMLVFNASVFFTYLLPPVIFYAGLSVEKQRFFSNISSILAYGVVGTFLSFSLLGICLHYLSFGTIKLQDSLAMAAVFAATDSVATLQVLNPDSMPLLFSLVFGEGVMNDATSVVLLRAMADVKESSVASTVVAHILTNFVYLFSTSLAMGGASGLLIAWALKRSKGLGPHQELALVGLLGYLSYLVGEVLGLSGILTLFCCGLVVSHYALPNISMEGRTTTMNTFRMLSTISEGSIFIYVGMDALAPLNWQKAQPGQVLWLFLVVMLILLISRAAFVFPISLLHNWWSSDKLSSRDMVIIWWAGLIRGAVSVALAYYQFDSRSDQKQHSTYIVTTLLVVLTTVLGLGAVTKPLLELMLREVPGQSLAAALRDIPEAVRWTGSGGSGSESSVAQARWGFRWPGRRAGYHALSPADDPAGNGELGQAAALHLGSTDASLVKDHAVVPALGHQDDRALSRDNNTVDAASRGNTTGDAVGNDTNGTIDKNRARNKLQLEFGPLDDTISVDSGECSDYSMSPPRRQSDTDGTMSAPTNSHRAHPKSSRTTLAYALEMAPQRPPNPSDYSTPSTSHRSSVPTLPLGVSLSLPSPDSLPSASHPGPIPSPKVTARNVLLTPPRVSHVSNTPGRVCPPGGRGQPVSFGSPRSQSSFASSARRHHPSNVDHMPHRKPTLSSMLYELWITFDEEYMQPLFGASVPQVPLDGTRVQIASQRSLSQELAASHSTLLGRVARRSASVEEGNSGWHEFPDSADRIGRGPSTRHGPVPPGLRTPQGAHRHGQTGPHRA